MYKRIKYGEEAREVLKNGVDKIARAVTTTLGAKGRNVAIGKGWLNPQSVNDGVTVAKEVVLEDPFENIGAQIVKEAASKTNEKAGDGTTTSTLLSQALIDSSFDAMADGVNPMSLTTGLRKARDLVVDKLRAMSVDVETKEQKKQVATISAQSEEIGEMVAEAFERVGEGGMVTFTESKGFDLELEVKEGTRIPSGFASPYFMTNEATEEAVWEDAHVLVLDMKLETVADAQLALNPLVLPERNEMGEVTQGGIKKLVIVGEVMGDALTTILFARRQGQIDALVVNPPHRSTRRTQHLGDLAASVGARIVSEDLGRTPDSITKDDLGYAEHVTANKRETVFIGGKGDPEEIEQRVSDIRALVKEAKDMEKEQLQQRLGLFSGNVAIIRVGADTEGEMIERKLRVEDAINAVQAAIDGGVVPGGGVALYVAREDLELGDLPSEIVYNALDKPILKILENAGILSTQAEKVLKKVNVSTGYNVMTMKHEDFMKTGVTDPTEVVVAALTNAISVAIQIITTDCVIVPNEEKGTVNADQRTANQNING